MFEKPGIAELRQAAQQLGMNPSEEYLRAVEADHRAAGAGLRRA